MTLKLTLIIAGSVIIIETIGLFAIGLKRPLVVGLSKNGPEILANVNDDDVTGSEVRTFIFDMLNRKFPAKPTAEKLIQVCPYFTEGLRAACEKELHDKKSVIPQEFILKELIWNDKNETARLQLKRFVTFGGSLTTVESIVNLRLVQRSRTTENPWGIFIDSWKEEVAQ
jgi:hypothetical protein